MKEKQKEMMMKENKTSFTAGFNWPKPNSIIFLTLSLLRNKILSKPNFPYSQPVPLYEFRVTMPCYYSPSFLSLQELSLLPPNASGFTASL